MEKLNIMFDELSYAMEEALNRLRINIKFCGKNTKKILVTSSVPSEGKSTIVLNLWKMMAEAGFPTVIVDLDLRKSVLKGKYIKETTGDMPDIGYYLSGNAELEDVVYSTNVENAYIVPCFNLLDSPTNLLEDKRLTELLEQLGEKYRYVLIDSPPLASVADAAQIAPHCDGVVFVVRGGDTPKGIIKQSLRQLERVGCKLLGVVLNRVDSSKRAYKGNYNKYYSSQQYGYRHKKKR